MDLLLEPLRCVQDHGRLIEVHMIQAFTFSSHDHGGLTDKHACVCIHCHSMRQQTVKISTLGCSRRGHMQAFACKTRADSKDRGRWTTEKKTQTIHMSQHNIVLILKTKRLLSLSVMHRAARGLYQVICQLWCQPVHKFAALHLPFCISSCPCFA